MMGGMGGGYDPRGPPLDARGFDPRGGFGRGGGAGYQRGARPMDSRGPPGIPGAPAMMGPPPRAGVDESRNLQVDREKQCPMLIRIFCKFGEHHRDEDFSYTQQPVEDEVLVHTWRDATLAELTELLAQEHREIRQSGTKCTFKVVFPSGEGKYTSRQLGSTAIGRRLPDDISVQTLAQIRFQVGDFVSVAIIPPRAAGVTPRSDEKERVRSQAAKREEEGGEEEESKEKRGRKEEEESKDTRVRRDSRDEEAKDE